MMAEPIPQWAKQLTSQINELETFLFDVPFLRDKTITNGKELEKICKTISTIKENTKLIPQILELVIANYTNYDDLCKKIDRLENSKTN
jgi:hypothetical protein